MTLYLLPTFDDLENGICANEEEPKNEYEVSKDVTVSQVTEGNVPLSSYQSLLKLRGLSDDGCQPHDNDIQTTSELPNRRQIAKTVKECDEIKIQLNMNNQHREKTAEECDDVSVQSDLDSQPVPVLVTEHFEDKSHFDNASVQSDLDSQPIPVLVTEHFEGKSHFDNVSVQSVDDFLDVRPNLDPEIREIVRLSNLRNGIPRSMYNNNESHVQYPHPSYGYMNTNFVMNQYMHNYPEQARMPPGYFDMPGVSSPYPDFARGPLPYLDMVRVPPGYPGLHRMPPHYSDYPHMSGVPPGYPDLSRAPSGYPDFNHHRLPFGYPPPYNPQGFHPNDAINRPRISPPGCARMPDNQYPPNFYMRPINGQPLHTNVPLRPIGQFRNTKSVRPPRHGSIDKPYGSSIQEVTDQLSDVSLFSSSSIVEKSQNESNTGDSEKNINESAKFGNSNREKLDTMDFTLSTVSGDSSGEKNRAEVSAKGDVTTKSVSRDSNATNYTVDDLENDDICLNSSEYSLDLSDDSKLPWYTLELIDLADVSGCPVEVWHYKDGAYVILQQAAKSIVDQEGNRTLVNTVVGCTEGGIEGREHHIIQDEFTVSSIMRSIEKSGRTSYSLGQQVKVMTKKHISLEEDYITLVPLMSLLDVFCTVRENFLVEMSDLMRFVISMLKKHSVAEESDDDSDSDN